MTAGPPSGVETWQPPAGSWASSEAIRKTMVGCRNRDTRPEIALRRAVHRRGLRYRVAARPIKDVRRSADLVFAGPRVAVFLDGCFWHACPEHFVPPKTNPDYWTAKIGGNVRRDRDTDRKLAGAGWLVLRVWEHEDPRVAARRVVRAVRGRQARLAAKAATR